MHWKDKMSKVIEEVLNEGQGFASFKVNFLTDNSFEVIGTYATTDIREQIYKSNWGDLSSHWKDAARKCLMRIREQEIDDKFQDLDEKSPDETGPFNQLNS